jgi:hypothetical protein
MKGSPAMKTATSLTLVAADVSSGADKSACPDLLQPHLGGQRDLARH